NAVKFTEKGSVSINADVLHREGDTLTLNFSVVDTGIGIAKEAQTCIFEQFVQADAAMSRKFGGTGLGTTISKELVGLMGGRIGLESKLNLGTTFWFTVPFHVSNRSVERITNCDPAASYVHVHGASNTRFKILVAEDNTTVQRVLKALLGEYHDVDLVKDGLSCINSLKKPHNYDIAIVDLQMPGLDGLEVIDQYNDLVLRGARRVPIIVLSANAESESIKFCLNAGADAYLTKPIDVELLHSTINKLCSPGIPPVHSLSTEIKGNGVVVTGNFKKAALLDIGYLDSLSKLLGHRRYDFYVSLFEGYSRDMNQSLEVMKKTLEEGNCQGFRRAVHSARGVTVSIGASSTGYMMSNALSSTSDDIQAMSTIYDLINSNHINVVSEFESYLLTVQTGT
ncbi:MAG: response regulator, partial [Taibaiella sp.]|nr:response regulator [Taibaiella sp.]